VAKLVLASQLARWLPEATAGEITLQLPGSTVRAVLDALFAQYPSLRGYVLDEHGRIRRHVALFVDGAALPHSADLTQPLGAEAELHVLQALSGG
jgi:hypothetical protein